MWRPTRLISPAKPNPSDPASRLRCHTGCDRPADLPAASAPAPPIADVVSFGLLSNMRFTLDLVLILVSGVLSGCATTKSYNIPYSRAESSLFEHLHLDKAKTLSSPRSVQAKAHGDLAKSMSMELFAVDLHEYTPGTSLSLTCRHLYNIGADGGQSIRFDLQRQTANKTRITVDYSDRWSGIWPPFVFSSPGLSQEPAIHSAIWGAQAIQ